MSWSRQRWMVMASLIFGAQILAIFALHTREPLRARLPDFGPRRSGGFSTNSVGSEADELTDPLVFAGAHPSGFSGAAWLREPEMKLSLSNSIAPPKFLAFQRSAPEVADSIPFRGLPTPLPYLNIVLPSEPPPQSFLLIEGALAGRPLLTNPIVPIQAGSDVLSNTVVQVGVRMDGLPFSTRIVTGSGSKAADAAALQMARELRFARQGAPGGSLNSLQWGQLIFQWFTAPPSTNNPVNAASK